MCLAFPGKVVEVKGDFAKIDFGGGTTRSDINISHTDAVKDDYVLFH
jgi:hydrogenase expression/formation protein HypC